MSEKMIIVGGGIAGLAAGCYARMNGFETQLFEQGGEVGGLCASWKRGAYTFDGCIHWLTGSAGTGLVGKYWNELGALQGRQFVYHEVFTRIETGSYADKETFTVYSDADKLNAEMKRLGPEDAARIDSFTSLIKKFVDFPAAFDKPFELMGLRDYLAMAGPMKSFMKEWKEHKDTTVAEYAARFSSPSLREGLTAILGDMPGFSFLALLLMLAWQHSRSAGYPIGGSLDFSRAIGRNYARLGGELRLSARVEKILVEGKKAVGVLLADGTEHRADIVVSAADGYETIFKLLSGKFCDRKLRERYESLPIFEPLFCLSLGVNRDFSSESHMSVRILRMPIEIEGKIQRKIGIKHFCYDPKLAPSGKSVVQIMYSSDYEYWKRLSADRGAYEDEKRKIAEALIGALEESYPGIGKDIEEIDAATPLSFERYTSNRRGTFEGWFMSPSAMTMRMAKTLPGLKNFYMVGQWVQPGGGLPNSLKSGRDLVYMLCEKRGKAFRTA
jgi:phytoene dehydrogenase-like protein